MAAASRVFSGGYSGSYMRNCSGNLGFGYFFLLFLAGLILKIYEEEKLLSQKEKYKEYINIVKWRLIPWVWL